MWISFGLLFRLSREGTSPIPSMPHRDIEAYSDQIKPRSAKLMQSRPATIKWSRTLTSISDMEFFNVSVRLLSAWLGSGLPLGWLCAKMTAAALWCKARFTTSLGYTDACDRVPRNNSSTAMTPCCEFRNTMLNTSCSSPANLTRRKFRTSSGLFRNDSGFLILKARTSSAFCMTPSPISTP